MDRRQFIKLAGVAGSAFTMSGLTLPLGRSAYAANRQKTFRAEAVTRTMIDGVTVPAWQFRDIAGSGPGRLTSGLLVRAGDVVTITIENDLDVPVNFVIPGLLESTDPVPAKTVNGTVSSRSYTFSPLEAGSYVYYDTAGGFIGRAMGLSGPLVVLPTSSAEGPKIVDNGAVFNRQYTLVLNELDSRLNDAINTGQSYTLTDYEPNYFFVNGLSYPDTKVNPSTVLSVRLNESVALRFINAGLIYNPMHFHGYHVSVVQRDRILETMVVAKDTVAVRPDECVDLLLDVNQTGVYPVHSHFLPAVTANGVYANAGIPGVEPSVGGALLLINATA